MQPALSSVGDIIEEQSLVYVYQRVCKKEVWMDILESS
jgi:hypothetical protein